MAAYLVAQYNTVKLWFQTNCWQKCGTTHFILSLYLLNVQPKLPDFFRYTAGDLLQFDRRLFFSFDFLCLDFLVVS
jgi:hypothetical protein